MSRRSSLWQRQSRRVQPDLPPQIPEIHLPAATAQSLYFAIKEALNNALKHARARSISLKAAVEGSVLRVSISDDGEGIRRHEDRAASAGLGLRGMRERLKEMGGECMIRTKEGEGVEVVLTLTIKAGERARM